ncbi:hypothetical protein TPR58_21565 [Sphingomonas sp. HF-S3]|uniref:J domain-containing protein n=1 Tax=Sphingomonas rustica TaxID=3103142 RepID=A0ABV0BEV5_9SPHN
MSWRHPCWAELGIEPTSDQRAIRVAYTRKLKTIDPERDPQAFIALREAFEAANEGAPASIAAPMVEEQPAMSPSGETIARERPRGTSQPRPSTGPTLDALSHALSEVLGSHRGPQHWLSDEDKQRLLDRWEALRDHKDMALVAGHANVERWISKLIAQTLPLSQPLVVPVVDYFGWSTSDGTLHQTDEIADVSRHYRLDTFLRLARTPCDTYYPAWAELRRPMTENALLGHVNPDQIRDLLTTIRHAQPELEHELDRARVARWIEHLRSMHDRRSRGFEDGPTGDTSRAFIWVICAVAFFVVGPIVNKLIGWLL